MKQILFFLTLGLIISCGGNPATGPQVDLNGYNVDDVGDGFSIVSFSDASELPLTKGAVLNGTKVGSWLTYHEGTNKVSTLTTYLNGHKNGIEITFNDRGQVESINEFKNNELHGLSGKYKFGRPSEETSYKDGKMHGAFRVYDNQSRIQKEGQLRDGQYHGTLKYYNEAGDVTMQYEYDNGKKVSGGIVEPAATQE